MEFVLKVASGKQQTTSLYYTSKLHYRQLKFSLQLAASSKLYLKPTKLFLVLDMKGTQTNIPEVNYKYRPRKYVFESIMETLYLDGKNTVLGWKKHRRQNRFQAALSKSVNFEKTGRIWEVAFRNRECCLNCVFRIGFSLVLFKWCC